MEGRARATQRRVDETILGAWHSEAFAREKSLKPLSKYLASREPKKAQGAEELLRAFKDMSERGAPIAIRRRDHA